MARMDASMSHGRSASQGVVSTSWWSPTSPRNATRPKSSQTATKDPRNGTTLNGARPGAAAPADPSTRTVGRLAGTIMATTMTSQPARKIGIASHRLGPPSMSA